MKDSVSNPFKAKNKIITVSGIFSFIIILSVYYALNTYFNKASLEVVENWYANEFINIQQGNTLSSVTKLQRTIEKSSFIKGVSVIDDNGHELVRFGNVRLRFQKPE